MADRPLSVRDVPFASNRDDGRFSRLGDGHYLLASPDALNTDLEVDHIRRERYQLYGELTAHCGLAGAQTYKGALFTASINLSSIRDRESVARALADRARTPNQLDAWKAVVDELGIRIAAAEREGDPAVILRDVPKRGPERFFRGLGFAVPERLPAMIFGDGDSLKTMAVDALAVELARQGVNVGIVDAEMTVDEHAERVDRLSGGNVPGNVVYLACVRPLIHERDRVAAFVREHEIRYLFLDSVAFLCHEKPESAEAAMSYFAAVRSFGVGTMSIAHVTKGEQGDQKPFGSTFWFNSVRVLWYAKRADQGSDPAIVDIGFYTRKFNLGMRPGAHALRFAFGPDRTTIAQVEPSSIESLAAAMPVKERVRTVLRNGARTIDELATEIPDADIDTLRRTIGRYSGDRAKFQLFTKLPDGRFGLADRGKS